MKECYTREQIEAAVRSKGYKYFTGGDYDVNIIGIRNSETKGRVTNAFDDCVTISYKVDGEWKLRCEPPIASFNALLLYPLDTNIGQPKCSLIG